MNVRRWQFAEKNPAVERLSQELKLPPLFTACAVNRGCHDSEAIASYLDPRLAHLSDPFLLPNIERAIDRLFQAHQSQERFVIFGDYDVDGVTATALLTEFFHALGWNSFYYLPHRLEEGYGLTRDGVERCLSKFEVKLLLAVDCGSSATEVIKDLQSRGVEVIVLDHHQVSSPLPPALAVVNPQLLPGDDPLKHFCSAGLAFKLAHALLKRCRALGWPAANDFDLKQSLDLAALGTVADIVPLQCENRILVRSGLKKLATTRRVGLQALKKVAGIRDTVSCTAVAFQLAPRLNASGRLESALDSLELLLTDNPNRAETLAASLDEQNRERQSLEKSITDEVITSIRSRFNPETDFGIVEADPKWHLGVVGIVASRVLREFHRPVLILGSDGTDDWRGSGRSIEGFDLAGALRQCSDLLLKHGGHAAAAGFTISSSRVADLRARFKELARTTISYEALQPLLKLDAETSLSGISFDLLKLLKRIEPVGHRNPPVQFAARRLRAVQPPRRFGSTQQHLRFTVTDGQASHQAIWWNCESSDLPASFDLAFAPELSEYNGTLGIQLRVLDLKPLST